MFERCSFGEDGDFARDSVFHQDGGWNGISDPNEQGNKEDVEHEHEQGGSGDLNPASQLTREGAKITFRGGKEQPIRLLRLNSENINFMKSPPK